MRMGSASTTCTTRRWAPRPTWPSVSACAPPSRTIPTKPSSSPASANRGSSTVPTTATTPCVEPAGCARGTTPSAACASSSCSPSALVRHYAVSAVGADRPGIVHRVASLLADGHVNIVDLSTRVIGDPDRPVYAMILEVTLPSSADAGALEKRLADLAADLGVECSLHPSEADIL